MKKYTVVGAYADQQSYVEWVEANTPLEAIKKAEAEDAPTRAEESWPVAVFEGHYYDVAEGIGA